jgi:cytochrome c-type biogenesis protein CcmH/NrfF
LLILFHAFILFKIIPNNIVWGGKYQTIYKMRNVESVSLVMNAFIIIVVAEKGKIIKIAISLKLINILLWALVVFFTLNTIGILAAKKRLLKQLFLIQ